MDLAPARDGLGFYQERHPILHPLESTLPGVFLAGTCHGPRDIAETVCQGSGVAARVIRLLTELAGSPEASGLAAAPDPWPIKVDSPGLTLYIQSSGYPSGFNGEDG